MWGKGMAKPAKKAAKKAAAKHADSKHHERKDLRRAYEHLGRVEALQGAVKGDFSKHVHVLVALAEKELGKGHRSDAANLLRAAEHFSFAALASSPGRPSKVSPELKDVVIEEFEHLTRKANEHWNESEAFEHHASVTALFRSSLEAAQIALDAGAFRPALELTRGAEALAHVKQHGPEQLESGAEHLRPAKL